MTLGSSAGVTVTVSQCQCHSDGFVDKLMMLILLLSTQAYNMYCKIAISFSH